MALLGTVALLTSCSSVDLDGVHVEEVGENPAALIAVDDIPSGSEEFSGVIAVDPDFTGGCVALHEPGPELFSTMLVWPAGTEPANEAGRGGVRTNDGTEYLKDDAVVVTGTRLSWPEEDLDLDRCGPSEKIQSVVLVHTIAKDN